jgi:hypothetical protein
LKVVLRALGAVGRDRVAALLVFFRVTISEPPGVGRSSGRFGLDESECEGWASKVVYPREGEASKADVYSPSMTWVQDGIFAAGGESIPQRWEDFATQTGITAVLHLRPVAPSPFFGRAPAAYLWLGADDEDEADDELRWLAGSFIRACLGEGRRVLLHASRGRHRTRWTYVAFQICAGSTPETALRRAARPPWMAPYHTDRHRWRLFAQDVGARLAPAPAETPVGSGG